MPFTETKDRRKMDKILELQRELAGMVNDIKPGDRCFVEYRQMMKKWNANPKWTTADQILSTMFPDDHQRAFLLAYLVFFAMKVMPYERQKERENGSVE